MKQLVRTTAVLVETNADGDVDAAVAVFADGSGTELFGPSMLPAPTTGPKLQPLVVLDEYGRPLLHGWLGAAVALLLWDCQPIRPEWEQLL